MFLANHHTGKAALDQHRIEESGQMKLILRKMV